MIHRTAQSSEVAIAATAPVARRVLLSAPSALLLPLRLPALPAS